MAQKLTNYDPAEDLGSDEAIAVFMAEAFQTNDVGYISHALGVLRAQRGWRRLPARPDFLVNSSIGLSAQKEIRL
jgi:probable addiction module antidote protein